MGAAVAREDAEVEKDFGGGARERLVVVAAMVGLSATCWGDLSARF